MESKLSIDYIPEALEATAVLHLTGAAHKLMPKIEAISKRVEERFEAGLRKGDLHTFHRVMMTMLDNVGEGHFSMYEEHE